MKKETGVVKWFDNGKGYGFIVNEDGDDVFVHYKNITGEGYKTLRDGDRCRYYKLQSDKGWSASEVEKEVD